ncbi:MAG: hypothetical protein ACKO8K_05080, partial [Candidatus Limnocylindrus sp.]
REIHRVSALIAFVLLVAGALPVRAHGEGGIALPIDSPAEAHEAVLATGAPFDDFIFLDGGLIGASQYFEVKGDPGSGATWVVTYTYVGVTAKRVASAATGLCISWTR